MNKTRKVSIYVTILTIMAVSLLATTVFASTNSWTPKGHAWTYYAKGQKVKNAWKQDSKNNWYYLSSNRVMVSNKWIKDEASWYYLGSNGAMVSNTWIKYGTSWYYVGETGAMLVDTITPDRHCVGDNGIWDGKPAVKIDDIVTFTFKDKALEKIVRYELKSQARTLLKSDVDKVDSICATNCNITDLSGIEKLTGLTSFSLSGESEIIHQTLEYGVSKFNKVNDITPLKKLTNLKSVALYGNEISDITPLKGLTKLQGFTLCNTQVSDITILNEFTNLTSFRLVSNNNISDISPLSGLTDLKYLFLHNNQFSDITPLITLTNLETLYLNNNQISDIDPLNGLTQLTYLNLNNNQISDITQLIALTNLKSLHLSNNQITDITPLTALTNLKFLDLSNNQISDADIEDLKKVLPNCSIEIMSY